MQTLKPKFEAVTRTRRAALFFAALLLASSLLFYWRSWHHDRANALERMSSMAEMGAMSLNGYFSSINSLLKLVSEELGVGGQALPRQRLKTILSRYKDAYPELNVTLVNIDGAVLASTVVFSKSDVPFVGGQPSFRAGVEELRQGKLFDIGRPFLGPLLNDWIVPLRFGVRDRSGNLVAILTASLPLSKPQSFWKDVRLPAGAAMGLVRDDGFLVSRYPLPESPDLHAIYGERRTGDLLAHLTDNKFPNSGKIIGASSLAGPGYLIAFRRLPDYPVTFFMMSPVNDAWAEWISKSLFSFVVLGLLLFGGWGIYAGTQKRQLAWEMERQRAEDKVHESEAQLAAIIGQAMDAIISIDEDQRVILFNAAAERMFGYRESEVRGQRVEMLIPRKHRPEHANAVRAFAAGGTTMRRMAPGTVTALDAQGREFPLETSISRLEVGGKKIMTAILRDITERRQAEAKINILNESLQRQVAALESANKELESYSYSVSHDLRSPLRIIEGYGHMLEEKFSEALGPEASRLLRVIRRNALRMNHLLSDLLEFSRIGREALHIDTVDMQKLVEAELSEQQSYDAYSRHRVTVGTLPGMRGDEMLLRQVWANLIANAFKYSEKAPAPAIEIGASVSGGDVEYYVRDNGVGFDMKYRDKLFRVFQRLHHVEDFPGSGLGLAIVERIVRRHGGQVRAEGQLGAGAVFYFSLPREGADEAGPPPAAAT